MWTHLITLIVGFVAGCKINDLLGKGNVRDKFDKSSKSSIHDDPFNSPKENKNSEYGNNMGYNPTVTNGFSLASIKHVFDNYGIGIINAGSFYVLLRVVRNQCYKNILKNIVEKATSADKLVELLRTETTPTFVINVFPSNKEPLLEEAKLDELIKQENINPSEIGNVTEKVKFLLTLSHTRGIEDFKNTLGSYFSEMLDRADSNEDVSELYERIMKTVRNRYEFLK